MSLNSEVNLVERHNISRNHRLYDQCDNKCMDSKNLYNSALYKIRQDFFTEETYTNYMSVYRHFRHTEQYLTLTDKIAKQTLRLLDKNFKSFFNALREYKKNPKKFKSRPRIPQYKDKTSGRCIISYDKESISKPYLDKGYIKLSNSDIIFKTKKANRDNIRQVRIVPKSNRYVIEVVYRHENSDYIKKDNCAIDIGLSNLLSCTFDNNSGPLIFNGNPLKSMNQWYNKNKAKIQNELKVKNNKYISRKLINLTNRRNNKIEDYLHHVSKELVNQLVSRNISDLYIGYNSGWKQDINIGKRNNQNFVNIPFHKLINMITYKCNSVGIKVHILNESYTSKCSFIDNEPIRKLKEYKGSRVKRGLFKSFSGLFINADINASYNILRKAIPDVRWDIGCAVHPKVINI